MEKISEAELLIQTTKLLVNKFSDRGEKKDEESKEIEPVSTLDPEIERIVAEGQAKQALQSAENDNPEISNENPELNPEDIENVVEKLNNIEGADLQNAESKHSHQSNNNESNDKKSNKEDNLSKKTNEELLNTENDEQNIYLTEEDVDPNSPSVI